jgi:DNA-directed RNA polymerase specialized sigma24 family protein
MPEDGKQFDLDRLILKLPWKWRHVVVRYYFDGVGLAQIGAEMGLSRGRAQQLRELAVRRLRTMMERASL